MKQTKWTKKRSEGLPRWAMGLLMGLCIGLIVVALGGLVIYVLLTGGARKEFDELAQRVEKETVGLPAGQTPKAYADLKAENPDFVGWIKILNNMITQLDGDMVRTETVLPNGKTLYAEINIRENKTFYCRGKHP